MTVQERIANAKLSLGRDSLVHVHYETNPGSHATVLVGIDCKLCGSPIMGPVEHEKMSKVVRHNGQNVIIKYVEHARFGAYTEVALTMDDGSKHVTHLCRGCVQKLSDPLVLEQIYAMDLAQWLFEEESGRGPAIWHVYPQVVDRRPVSYEDLGGLD